MTGDEREDEEGGIVRRKARVGGAGWEDEGGGLRGRGSIRMTEEALG